MKEKEPINIFDFDGTLTTETWPKFSVWLNKFGYVGGQRNDLLEAALAKYRKNHEGSILETYFGFLDDLLRENHAVISYEELMSGEKYIHYNPGFLEYFRDSKENNYVVSGGYQSFLENLSYAKYFKGFYGTTSIEKNGFLIGTKDVMTDEKKVDAIKDILKKNNCNENDCENVYYIGDGYSDREAFKYVHDHGGKAIFVYRDDKEDALQSSINNIYQDLKRQNIIDYFFLADFHDNSMLSRVLKRKDK